MILQKAVSCRCVHCLLEQLLLAVLQCCLACSWNDCCCCCCCCWAQSHVRPILRAACIAV
jgi:hypothetical protein